MTNIVLDLVHWTGSHPTLAGLLVALVACAESLAFIGLLVPGAIVMLGAGALVGVGALPFWSTLCWAVGGAIVGDGVSYWIGHRYSRRFTRLRFVRGHPELLERGEAFFRRHGGKSIMLARFVGPVRPVVPVVAGMLGMSPGRFYAYNALSALAWAPAHLIPGMAFGASLALAGQVAGRLTLGLSALLAFVWIVMWGARSLYRWVAPHANGWAAKAMNWSQGHPRLAWLVGDLLDPERPVSRPLLAWLALLIGSGWLFFGVLEDVVGLDPLVYAGQSLFHLLQGLRTPAGDLIMTALTEMGDAAVVIPVLLAVLAWLAWKRVWRDARYWLAAAGFGALAVVSLKMTLHFPRPVALYTGTDAYSFPSGHTTLSTVIYGFLAVLSARSLSARTRWIPYALAVMLVSGIAFSRLYLGAHWLADVIAGIGLGTAWVAVLAIARGRHAGSDAPIPWLPVVGLVAFLTAATWHIHDRLAADLDRYVVKVAAEHISEQAWWDSGSQVPAYRLDLQGEMAQPLNIQWAGRLDVLKQALSSQGWHVPLLLSPRAALQWLLPHAPIDRLPVLPQLHDGRSEALVMVHAGDPRLRPGEQLILRVWPTAASLEPSGAPLWVGTVAWQRIARLPLIGFPGTTDRYSEALAMLRPTVTEFRERIVTRNVGMAEEVEENGRNWNGDTLLIAAGP
ncbi:bifunctional DedA family/phosphatase PAP2 family protein [Thiobacillus sedimenti]|uniref:VTT domain-containing protein n=1 Tax=Thiobacillus sedimenti TaxID=3110231 RepID=A0ABZ1CMJ5_9PROT|nr:VTT domain-containing protein [Thiobacillus sp. SCUT-2]WRS40622.1 VTT domain-containing protein [Thiobacillus sp. SCUT-2]